MFAVKRCCARLIKHISVANRMNPRIVRSLSEASGLADCYSGVRIGSFGVDGSAKKVLERFKYKAPHSDTIDIVGLHSSIDYSDSSFVQHYGEDACFVNPDFFAVADGVGGWKKHGVDPAVFASKLMINCLEHTMKQASPSPVDTLRGGFDALKAETPAVFGGSTACVAHIDTTAGQLNLANLGDSGWRVIRDGKVLFSSEDQRHTVFTPYQLSIAPEGHNSILDLPESADVHQIDVEPGDVLVLATDGLFDNVYADEIESCLADAGNHATAQELAKELVRLGVNCMMQRDRISPFAMRANDDGFCVLGGKIDDITVVVARIEH